MTIFKIQSELKEKEQEKIKLDKDYRERSNTLQSEISKLEVSLQRGIEGLDIEKMKNGESIVYVHGKLNTPTRKEKINFAINDLLSNSGKFLQKQYVGVKNYEGFGDQGCNCSYGMGPKHGSIVFEIGMLSKYRDVDLSEAELESAIYYLSNYKTD